MTDDDLDLVETTRLVDALRRRLGQGGCVAVVTISEQPEGEGKVLHFRGGYSAALGALAWAHHDLLNLPPIGRRSADGN